MSLIDLVPALGAAGAILATILGMLRFFEERREKRAIVREAFASVVKSLSNEHEVERLAAAILLRRFFNPRTEVGFQHTPFAQDAVGVIASLLRSQKAGNFQKLLADGLAYAPTLVRADLQKTNLQEAYLGSQKVGLSDDAPLRRVDLSFADFYRADLSGASLKDATARGAQFYQARLIDTVFRGADLRAANFYGADLRGAKFDGARLAGANFQDARNLPAGIAGSLDGAGIYRDEANFAAPKQPRSDEAVRVFISRPGVLVESYRHRLAAVRERVEQEGLMAEMLERTDYPSSGALAEVQRVMAGCSGAVILGLRDMEVSDGVWRAGTPDERRLNAATYATPWSQIEAGMALMQGFPILIVAESSIQGGIFDMAASEHNLFRLGVAEDLGSSIVGEWSAAVKARADTI
jgi:Pentapeptide repeats (8 copies)